MSKILALPVAFTATIGASVKRVLDARAARQRAHAQAKRAEYCREYCWSGTASINHRVNRCDCV